MTTEYTEPAGLSDEELMELMPQQFRDDLATVSRMAAHGAGPDVGAGLFRVSLNTGALNFARAAISADRVQRQPEPEQPTRRHLMMLAADMGMASVDDAAEYARAVLARWCRPAPQPPADGEVQGLGEWLRELGAKRGGVFDVSTFCANLARAAELLSQRHPQPVPVSERPWERKGWCDKQGQCWWFNPGQPAMSNPHIATSSWRLCRMLNGKPMGAYSLPAHALPLPVEVNK